MYNENKENHACECDAVPHASPKEVFASSAPYPPVRISERNQLYGRMMLDNMGGQNSEMSTIGLYIYNNILIIDNERLSSIFKGISIVEMHHLHTFGEIARLMGENPRLWTHRGNQMAYWSPSYKNYPMQLEALLLNALNGEKMAVQKYQNQCAQIQDICIVECLERIIEDEKIHIKIFESLYEEYCS